MVQFSSGSLLAPKVRNRFASAPYRSIIHCPESLSNGDGNYDPDNANGIGDGIADYRFCQHMFQCPGRSGMLDGLKGTGKRLRIGQRLSHRNNGDVLFGRIKRQDPVFLATPQTVLEPGDLVIAVGTEEDLHKVASFLGQQSSEHIGLDRSEYDYRRIFVSNSHVAGRTISELRLQERFGAVVTRVRRGDVDFSSP